MENKRVIYLSFLSLAPTGDEETFQRFVNWNTEVYFPLLMKVSGTTGIDCYKIFKNNRQYPRVGAVHHYENIAAYENSVSSPERKVVREEVNNWNKRGVREGVWAVIYELVQSFRLGSTSLVNNDTRIENSPVMHIEACSMTAGELDKYNSWFSGYGGKSFIPLFMKNCGLKGFDYYRRIDITQLPAKETEYPAYLSLLYFDDMKAFENFDTSAEQRSFQSALRNVFPLGLNYKWFAQYELIKSFRK